MSDALPPDPPSTKVIKVDYLARVEGEGGLVIKTRRGQVTDIQLKIFEPPRFFEAFLRGRGFLEAPDITARICGICPVAYQMSTVHAVEDAFDVEVPEHIRLLRRAFYCGEWIESHTLHVYMLHAPDFLGFHDAIALAKVDKAAVERGLMLKKTGNELIAVLGGREIHPINVRPGGFYRLPTRAEIAPLVEKLKRARDMAVATVEWVGGFDFPDFTSAYELVSLRAPGEYPLCDGRIVSSAGIDVASEDYEGVFEERQVSHSTALHSVIAGRGAYLVGPLARFANNFTLLPADCQALARAAGVEPGCRNIFKSIVVRAVEVLFAVDEALRILASMDWSLAPHVEVRPRAGKGFACTEAPRGILYHRLEFDADGKITQAKIVPPTAQNQLRIEQDLRELVTAYIKLPKKDLTLKCEQAVRSYDPCISCATHFLNVDLVDDV
jgi:coenzyme F420-reducing hydrogenase alpha subunit